MDLILTISAKNSFKFLWVTFKATLWALVRREPVSLHFNSGMGAKIERIH